MWLRDTGCDHHLGFEMSQRGVHEDHFSMSRRIASSICWKRVQIFQKGSSRLAPHHMAAGHHDRPIFEHRRADRRRCNDGWRVASTWSIDSHHGQSTWLQHASPWCLYPALCHAVSRVSPRRREAFRGSWPPYASSKPRHGRHSKLGSETFVVCCTISCVIVHGSSMQQLIIVPSWQPVSSKGFHAEIRGGVESDHGQQGRNEDRQRNFVAHMGASRLFAIETPSEVVARKCSTLHLQTLVCRFPTTSLWTRRSSP